MISEALRAATLPVEALGLLRRERRLKRLAVGPILVSLVLVALAILAVANLGGELVASFRALLPGWLFAGDVAHAYEWLWVGPLRALFWILEKLAWLLLYATAVLASVLLSGALAAPLLDLLSAAVEDHVRGVVPEADSGWWAILRSGGRGILEALARLALLLFLWLGLAILALLIPVLGVFTPLLLAAATGCFATLDHAAYALDRRQLGLADKGRWLGQNRAGVLGFGAAALFLSALPVVNLIAAPVLAIAGTLFVLSREPQPKVEPQEPS